MLTNTGPVAKLYLSIIDDVIESMRELFLDEGFEDRVLDDLRHLWESKMMQSKAMEDFRKSNINSSNFVLQLPANYNRTDPELRGSVVIPASQTVHSFPVKNSAETLATFSLPAGLAYPVQIPAGVTLQTASGQLYKVNVPVVVTQAPAGQHPHKVSEWRDKPAPAPAPAAIPPSSAQDETPSAPPATSVTQPSQPTPSPPPHQDSSPPQQPQQPAAEASQEAPVTQGDGEPRPQPVNLSTSSSPCGQLGVRLSADEPPTQSTELKTRDIDDILKEVIEEEREKAARAKNVAPAKASDQPEGILGLDLDYNYTELLDIVQLDGPADDSDAEEEEPAALEENDFLGLINAEAIKALEEGEGSSDSISSSSDSEGADELADVEEEDPLNSGDDVIEQDIPDLFDTENVIVCQYDKIHRSKNRWKFHLKDGVMSYGGRDYVFSKAVGEAEW